jgi:hypothetical protein
MQFATVKKAAFQYLNLAGANDDLKSVTCGWVNASLHLTTPKSKNATVKIGREMGRLQNSVRGLQTTKRAGTARYRSLHQRA